MVRVVGPSSSSSASSQTVETSKADQVLRTFKRVSGDAYDLFRRNLKDYSVNLVLPRPTQNFRNYDSEFKVTDTLNPNAQ